MSADLRPVVVARLIELRFPRVHIVAQRCDQYGVLVDGTVTFRPVSTLKPGDLVTGFGRLTAIAGIGTEVA